MNKSDRNLLKETIEKQLIQSKTNVELARKMYYNSVCKQNVLTEKLRLIKDDNIIELKKSGVKNVYYAGGTLCVDLQHDVLIMFNLNETVNVQMDCHSWCRLLSIENVKLVFQIYENTKGITKYYKEQLYKSCYSSLQIEKAI